jgi:hypothetical protein
VPYDEWWQAIVTSRVEGVDGFPPLQLTFDLLVEVDLTSRPSYNRDKLIACRRGGDAQPQHRQGQMGQQRAEALLGYGAADDARSRGIGL